MGIVRIWKKKKCISKSERSGKYKPKSGFIFIMGVNSLKQASNRGSWLKSHTQMCFSDWWASGKVNLGKMLKPLLHVCVDRALLVTLHFTRWIVNMRVFWTTILSLENSLKCEAFRKPNCYVISMFKHQSSGTYNSVIWEWGRQKTDKQQAEFLLTMEVGDGNWRKGGCSL